MRRHGNRRDRNHKIDILSQLSLFGACTRGELAELAQMFDEIERTAGTVLVREGDPGKEFYVIVSGVATATIDGRIVSTLGLGSFFGEMSLLEHAPRSATVTAETDVELLVADARSFTALVDSAPSVGIRMMKLMSERLRSVESPSQA
jgi:CRP-like cAMP-binding protein